MSVNGKAVRDVLPARMNLLDTEGLTQGRRNMSVLSVADGSCGVITCPNTPRGT